jgi:hypothetical protein
MASSRLVLTAFAIIGPMDSINLGLITVCWIISVKNSLEKDLESLQQYGRRNSLRFHNVPMNSDNIQGTDGLVLKVCKDHLGVELKIDDIDRSHIIGNITNGKGQIICRLRNWKIKNKIYSNKSSWKITRTKS